MDKLLQAFRIPEQALVNIGKNGATPITQRVALMAYFVNRYVLFEQWLDFAQITPGMGLPGIKLTDVLQTVPGKSFPLPGIFQYCQQRMCNRLSIEGID